MPPGAVSPPFWGGFFVGKNSMTVSSATSKTQYNGDGATIVFSTGFNFELNTDVVVILRDASAVETTWVEGTQYTLDGAGTGSNGTVTVDDDPVDYTPQIGETLTITREPPETQETDYPPGGAFPAESTESALDKLTHLVQAHSDELSRTLQATATDDVTNFVLPSSAARANKDFQFDSAGNPVMAEPSDLSGASVTAAGSTTSRLLAERFASVVDVKDFGAAGDGSTDDSAAVQASIDHLLSNGGGILRFPPGSFKIGTQLTLAYGSIGLGDLGTITIEGAGAMNTEIKSSIVDDFVLVISSASFQALSFTIRDIKFEGTGNGGHGLQVKNIAHWTMENVFIYAFKTGFETEDCLTMSFHHCIWRWNWYGILGLPQNLSSSPNAWSFYGCVIGKSYNQGMEITNPGQLTYVGGTVEGNAHTLSGGEAQGFGVKIVDDGTAPVGRGATFIGTYLAGNNELADLWIWAKNGGSLAFLNAYGCRFIRSTEPPAQYGVRADVGATDRVHVSVRDAMLSQHPGYTPSASNRLVNSFVTAGGIYRENLDQLFIDDTLEAPSTMQANLFAGCIFDGTSGTPTAVRPLNISGISKTGTGDYTLTWDEGWQVAKVNSIQLGASGIATIFAQSALTMRIKTFAVDGTTATDFAVINVLVFQ